MRAWMYLKSDWRVCVLEGDEDFIRRARESEELQMAGVVNFIRSLPSE